MNLLVCLHLEMNSSLLFITDSSFCIIISFSDKQRSHFFAPTRYGWHFFKTENLTFSLPMLQPESTAFQNSFDSSVLLAYFLWLKEDIWSLYLPLTLFNPGDLMDVRNLGGGKITPPA